jgi:lysophospholipase L1-like esterase
MMRIKCRQWFRLPVMFSLVLGGLQAAMGAPATPPAAAAEGKIIAVYGQAAASKDPPPGWRFLWNAQGGVGDSKGYASLAYDAGTLGYGVPDAAGKLMANRPGSTHALDVCGVRDADGMDRYYIAAYTLQDEPRGEVWINHGNIRNRSFHDGRLAIYVNDDLKFSEPIAMDRFARVFQKNMGRLKQGDVIRVAVGPGEKSKVGGGRLLFVIQEFPEGRNPGPPLNIISPPLMAAEPQRDVDGTYAEYLKRHEAQCAAVLSNRTELVFIGDSITARWPAEMLQPKFGKYRPVNLGVGGDWIQNTLWRVMNGVLDQVRLKVIVLLIGTNNLTHRYTPEEAAAAIDHLVRALREKAPRSKILLLGILPGGGTIQAPKNATIRQTNERLARLADNQTVFFLDVGDTLVEPDGTIRADVMPDKLHVAGPGYERWLEAMGPVLASLLEKADKETL